MECDVIKDNILPRMQTGLQARLGGLSQQIKETRATLAKIHQLESNLEQRMIKQLKPATDIHNANIHLDKQTIEKRIDALACELIQSGIQNPILISVMDGAMPFAAKLNERLAEKGFGFQYETIQVSSYVGTTSGKLSITSSLKIPVGGKHIIVVDDVCDSGKTYGALRKLLFGLGAQSVDLMALVDKTQPRDQNDYNPGFTGFTVHKDAFIAGWGMDYEGLLRNFDNFIGAVDPATLPSKDEKELLQQKKPLNLQLQKYLATEKQVKKQIEACHHSLTVDSFYFNCVIGIGTAGAAITALGILILSPVMVPAGLAIMTGAAVALYNHGLFSMRIPGERRADSKLAAEPAAHSAPGVGG